MEFFFYCFTYDSGDLNLVDDINDKMTKKYLTDLFSSLTHLYFLMIFLKTVFSFY